MSTLRREWNKYVLPILSAFLTVLSLPYIGFSYLSLCSLVPLFLFLFDPSISKKDQYVGTLLFGILYCFAVVFPLFLVSGSWWMHSPSFSPFDEVLWYSLIIVAVSLFSGTWYLPIVALVQKTQRGRWFQLIGVSMCWACIEWARARYGLYGFSWGVIGYTLVDVAHWFPLVARSYGGVYALSGMIVLFNLALTFLWKETKKFNHEENDMLSLIRRCAALPQLRLIGAGIIVSVLLYAVGDTYTNSKVHMKVSVIGSKISTDASISKDAYMAYRKDILLAFQDHPKIILLPENVFPFFEIDERSGELLDNGFVHIKGSEEMYQDLLHMLKEHPDTVVAMGLHTKATDQTYRNSLVVFSKGVPVEYYHKRKLVPFTEFAPPGIDVPIVASYKQGDPKQILTIGSMVAAVRICSEIGDSTLIDIGENIILVPSNDGVFRYGLAARMHEEIARMLAVEHGAIVLRANKEGTSAIIDRNGEVIVSGDSGVLTADITL